MELYEFIGWIGVFSFILAYILLIMNRLSSDRETYHILNALGGICLVVNAIALNDIPNLIVNIVWMAIALFATYKIATSKKLL